MVKFFYIFLLLLSNWYTRKKTTNSLPTEEQAILVYKEGLDALEKRDFYASKKLASKYFFLYLTATKSL